MACYCRVSTGKVEQIESLANQEAYFKDYAKRNNYLLHKIYADKGISGKQMKNRVEFQKMLVDARQGKFDILAVKDISRFARNTLDFLEAFRELKNMNIGIIFTNNNLGSNDPEFVLTILASLAQNESAAMSERIKFGKRINAKKGKVPNFVFGYDKVDTFTLVINEEESKVVKKMYDLYLNEGYGTLRVAEYLNDKGILTKKNQVANWYQKTVADILKNPIYTGKIINGKTEIADFITGRRITKDESEHIIVERPELRIVSDEEYNNVQEELRKRSKAFNPANKARRNSTKYPFSNLIICEDCGYTFRRLTRQYSPTGKIYKRWCCSIRNAKGKNACPNKIVIDEGELLEYIRDFLNDTIMNQEEAIKRVLREVDVMVKDKFKDIDFDEESLNKEINKLKAKRQRCTSLYIKGIVPEEEVDMLLLEINEDMKLTELRLTQVKNNSNLVGDINKEIHKYFNSLKDLVQISNWTNVDLKKIIDNISVNHKGEIDVNLKLYKGADLPITVPFCKDRS